jgi:hypothetical protein
MLKDVFLVILSFYTLLHPKGVLFITIYSISFFIFVSPIPSATVFEIKLVGLLVSGSAFIFDFYCSLLFAQPMATLGVFPSLVRFLFLFVSLSLFSWKQKKIN